jgi:hypothetical protein
MPAGEFNRVLAVHNPVCSQPEKAAAVIAWLRDSRWGSGLELVTTQDPYTHDNVQLVRDALQPGDIVIGLGGDGLANDIFNAMHREREVGRIGRDEVAMVPIPAGNGNDLTQSLYGKHFLRGERLPNLLERRETGLLDGMKIGAGNGLDKLAHSYVGLGFTGRAAEFINRPDFRARRRSNMVLKRMQDGIQVARALGGLEAFGYETDSGEIATGKEKLYTLMPRVAAGVIKVNTTPFDREIVGLELGARAFILNALAAIGPRRLDCGANGEVMDEPQELTFRTDTPLQYDGEPAELPAGTTLTIAHHLEVARVLI